MLLNTMETVTVQKDDKVEYLHFGETPGKNPCFSLHSTDEGYQDLCKLSNLPSLHELKMRVQELNSMWDIRPTPVGTDGVQ